MGFQRTWGRGLRGWVSELSFPGLVEGAVVRVEFTVRSLGSGIDLALKECVQFPV